MNAHLPTVLAAPSGVIPSLPAVSSPVFDFPARTGDDPYGPLANVAGSSEKVTDASVGIGKEGERQRRGGEEGAGRGR